MNVWTQLFILLIFGSMISCTEEISDEIQNEATSTPSSGGGDSSTLVETPSIRVVNTKDSLLSYVMHKAGTQNEACELVSPAGGFDAENYSNNDPDTVIDCVLDAEEFDLYFEGAALEIQVDSNLCEYVQYRPFKYFQWQPGTTGITAGSTTAPSKVVHEVICDDICAADITYSAVCGKSFATTAGFPALSNEYTDEDDLETSALCAFDYSDETNSDGDQGPNCDEGKFRRTTYNLLNDPNNPGTCIIDNISDEDTSCGGSRLNCYGGNATDVLEQDEVSLITQNLALDSLTIPVEMDSPFSKGEDTNLNIVNYSRICSSTSNTKLDSDFDVALTNLLGNEIETMTPTTAYSPIAVDIEEDGVIDHYIYADHPFRGQAAASNPRGDVSPYYSIRCLDSARDTKAQIRVFVREWDRTFNSSNLFMSRISDVNQGVNARMDADGEQEPGSSWNNFLDWDDFLGDYDLSSTFDSNTNDGRGTFDPVFIDNQCTDINTGYCFDGLSGLNDAGFTNETTCAAASINHYWIPSREGFPEFIK